MSSQPNATAPSAPTLPAPAPLAELVPIDAADAKLRDTLKRCSPATYEAAREFRRSGNVDVLPALMHGIIERYVERERRGKLAQANDSLRLIEDLGLDSLTLMEIVVLAEEILPISIDNEDMCHLRTLGDVKQRVTELMISLKSGAQIPPPPAPAFAPPGAPLTSR
ncbi:MAG TPA: acyl carrier protein [Opitutaceae bacterium]|nr:acyl carrier protein [Opitutaceae bacterium]